MPRRFTVTVSRKMGARRAGGRGFVSEAESQVVDFYRDVVQALKAWQPSAPKLPAQIATPERAEMDQPLEQAAPAYLEETRGEYEHSNPAS